MEILGLNPFWSATVSNFIAGLGIAFIVWLIQFVFKRISQRNLTKSQRLKDQLRQHHRDLLSMGRVALRELFNFMLITTAGVMTASWVHIFALQTSLGFTDPLSIIASDPSIASFNNFYTSLTLLPTVGFVWAVIVIFGPIRKITVLFYLEDWKSRRLYRQIKEIDPDWRIEDP